MTRSAIILAGGLGTRLREVVQDIPKPMATINERPFLAHLLEYLAGQGIEEAVLAVSYKGEVIQEYFGNRYHGIDLAYSYEEEPMGTGGGIRQAFDLLMAERAFIFNGDTFFRIDLKKLNDFHFAKNSRLSIALREMKDFSRYGTVVLNDDKRITGFMEKKLQASGLINGGVYLIESSLFEQVGLQGKFSFEKDIMEDLVDQFPFYGLAYNDYFIDIGIPEDYARAQEELG